MPFAVMSSRGAVKVFAVMTRRGEAMRGKAMRSEAMSGENFRGNDVLRVRVTTAFTLVAFSDSSHEGWGAVKR